MSKLIRYLGQHNRRPLLPGGYHRLGDDRPATHDERRLIARRLARTPQGAQALIRAWGSADAAIRHVPPPRRKRPPVARRLWRFVRYWFPG